MVPTLSNKYVFEPSYNDLKFMIQNHNYFCANLIHPTQYRYTDMKDLCFSMTERQQYQQQFQAAFIHYSTNSIKPLLHVNSSMADCTFANARNYLLNFSSKTQEEPFKQPTVHLLICSSQLLRGFTLCQQQQKAKEQTTFPIKVLKYT